MAATPRLRDVSILLGGLLATAAVVGMVRVMSDVSPTTAALALLLVVLLTATYCRLWIAISGALAATLGLNLYFLPPVGTLTIAEPQNWVALVTFLVTAVIASNLSAAAQARASEAVARRNEVTRLFDLTRDVLLTSETTGAIETLARHVARHFETEPGQAAGHQVHAARVQRPGPFGGGQRHGAEGLRVAPRCA